MQVIHFANLAENGNDAFDNGKKSFSKRYVISNLNFNYNIDNNILYVRLIFSNFFFTNYKLFIHLHIYDSHTIIHDISYNYLMEKAAINILSSLRKNETIFHMKHISVRY